MLEINKCQNNNLKQDRVPFIIPKEKLLGFIQIFDGRGIVKIPFTQLIEDVKNVKSKLKEAGLKPSDCVGIRGENCYEWIVYDLAVTAMGCILVCFSEDNFDDKNVEEFVNHFELSLLLVTKIYFKENWNKLDWIYIINDEKPSQLKLRLILKAGDLKKRIATTDTFTLVFSSGTSGELKCLLLSKKGIQIPIDQFADDWELKRGDGILVALPMSIFQQRLMVYACLRKDSNILLTTSVYLFRSIKELKPSVILGPPALFETIEQRFLGRSYFKRQSMKIGEILYALIPFKRYKDKFFKRLYRKFHQALGGNVRVLLTGSAPSKLSTLKFYKSIKLPLFQVYGLAEIGFIAWNRPHSNKMMSVGKPIISNSVKLAEDGEIIVTVEKPQCNGYFGIEHEKQSKTFLTNGDVATGDLGKIDEDGFLFITGRKKNIILLSSGIKVNPETIEYYFEKIAGVDRIVAIGGDWLMGLALIVAIDPNTSEEDEARIEIEIEVLMMNYNKDLKSGEKIYKVIITRVEFTTENGLVTRNLKTDRNAVMKFFEKDFLMKA